MVHITVSKGLDIPIKGRPEGSVKSISLGNYGPPPRVSLIALDLNAFEETKFRVMVQPGDKVKIGQSLAEDKEHPGRMFVSPAGGIIHEIRRGLKRRLLDIVIEVATNEESESFSPMDPAEASREELIDRLKQGGLFARIRQRPFNFLANPDKAPRSIFVKALESAPFAPPSELQVSGYEKEFQRGLDALIKLTPGKVHLVYRKDSNSLIFPGVKGVEKHTVEGPHPAANHSLHIQEIDPIRSPTDTIWTLNASDVVAIGYFLLRGQYFFERVISIAGPGILPDCTGFFKVREGFPVEVLVKGRLEKGKVRLISGDILTGRTVETGDYLGFYDYGLCAIPEDNSREFLHFLRLGTDKYTFSKTYLSGHSNDKQKEYDFTTKLHGEHRPFIDPVLYDRVMPLNVSTMHLVKAVLAEDYDLAVSLGLIEVDSEDFALPSFVDPSKIEMGEIIKQGLRRYAADVLK